MILFTIYWPAYSVEFLDPILFIQYSTSTFMVRWFWALWLVEKFWFANPIALNNNSVNLGWKSVIPITTWWFQLGFLKMGQLRPLLSFIFGLFNQTSLQFLPQILVQNVHPVYSVGIRTFDLRNTSLLSTTGPKLPPWWLQCLQQGFDTLNSWFQDFRAARSTTAASTSKFPKARCGSRATTRPSRWTREYSVPCRSACSRGSSFASFGRHKLTSGNQWWRIGRFETLCVAYVDLIRDRVYVYFAQAWVPISDTLYMSWAEGQERKLLKYAMLEKFRPWNCIPLSLFMTY